MNLTINQFDLLVYLEARQEEKHAQRALAKALGLSVGMINKLLSELQEKELLCANEQGHFEVTLKGYAWLEPYRVKKAIFLAAGFGSRLVPITLNTPKPLIMVHGKRIIETLLDAVLAAGITDITIVRGYLGEQFDLLLKKYPMIRFIDNPIYNESNNLSSAMLIKDQMENAYVLESDLLLYHPHIIRKYEYRTNYCGFAVERSDDWCFQTKNGMIKKVSVGGQNCYQMVGISYWSKEDAQKMANDVEKVFAMPGGREKYWDEVALTYCKEHYDVLLREIDSSDIIEIDTFNELKQLDPIYRGS